MLNAIHIYDIDGTLVDSSHRYRTVARPDGSLTIDFPFWVANRCHAAQDSLLPLAAQYQAQTLDPEIFTVLATARAPSIEELRHIENNLIMPNYYIYRQAGDTRGGADLKINALENLFIKRPALRNLPGYIYEDNIDYMEKIAKHFNYKGVYCESKQGY